MAAFGNVEAQLNGITDQIVQNILKAVFRYVLKNGITFGNATKGSPALNMQGGYFSGTTPSTANQEFAIAHSFGRTPYLAIPVLPLDQVNAAIPRLQVSRAADASNLYLKSPETGQTVFFYIEG